MSNTTSAEQRYATAYGALVERIGLGQGDSDGAERLRDTMDGLWWDLTPAQQAHFRDAAAGCWLPEHLGED